MPPRSILDPRERFMRRVEVLPNGCWLWTGAVSRGKGNTKWYASFRDGKKTWRAHAYAHDILGGKTCPKGHHRDHTCNLSLCVNPNHLEAVPKSVNQARKMARKAARPRSVVVQVLVPWPDSFLRRFAAGKCDSIPLRVF